MLPGTSAKISRGLPYNLPGKYSSRGGEGVAGSQGRDFTSLAVFASPGGLSGGRAPAPECWGHGTGLPWHSMLLRPGGAPWEAIPCSPVSLFAYPNL